MARTRTVKRGYVLVSAERPRPSAVLPSMERAEQLRKRFGGRIIDAEGLNFTLVQGLRTLTPESQAKAFAMAGVA